MPLHVFSKPGVFVILLAGALLTGCGQQQEQAQPATTPTTSTPSAAESAPPPARAERPRGEESVTLTEADDGRALAMQRGQVVEIKLQADRRIGFTWIPVQNALPVLATDGVPQYETVEGAADTAPGIETWRFIGREPGHAHLVFEYRRPFEADAPPDRTVTFHFDVE